MTGEMASVSTRKAMKNEIMGDFHGKACIL